MEYPIGSVCKIVGDVDPEFKHKECTIIGGLAMRESSYKGKPCGKHERYVVNIQGFGDTKFHAKHKELQIKRFPGDLHSKCTEFVNQLITRQPNLVTEDV